MKILGNFLWIFFGGFILAILWGVIGILCCCTIIGIPLGIQCFKFANLTFWPFGRELYYSSQSSDIFWNVLWIIAFGWELAVLSCIIALVWCVTIVGIPFGIQCFKFARLALMPFGASIG